MLERYLVAKKESFVGGHCLDHLDAQRSRRPVPEALDQLRERAHPVTAGDRQKPALGEVLLLDRKHQPGALAQELAKIIEVCRGHGRSPANRRVSFVAISGSGSTAEQSPALVT